MPSEPRILALRDDLVDTLAAMSKAEGYWYDYGTVQVAAAADWDATPDFDEPRRYVLWDGEEETDSKWGGEAAEGSGTNRFRRWYSFIVTVAVKDTTDPERIAWRIQDDHHRALIGQSNRHRSGTRVNTTDTGVAWEPLYEGGQPLGGVLAMRYAIRWDHLSGDMASQ